MTSVEMLSAFWQEHCAIAFEILSELQNSSFVPRQTISVLVDFYEVESGQRSHSSTLRSLGLLDLQSRVILVFLGLQIIIAGLLVSVLSEISSPGEDKLPPLFSPSNAYPQLSAVTNSGNEPSPSWQERLLRTSSIGPGE